MSREKEPRNFVFEVTWRVNRRDTHKKAICTIAAKDLNQAYELMADYGKRNFRRRAEWKAVLMTEER